MQDRYDSLWERSWDAASEMGPGFRSRHEILLRLLAERAPRGSLLDVGAGTGRLLLRIHDRFPWLALSACETAPAAAGRLRDLPFLREVLTGDPADGALGDRRFRQVVCSEVLEHAPRDSELLAALAGALLPGGHLLLSVPAHACLWTPLDDAVGHLRRYEPGQVAAMCRAAGLAVDVDVTFGFPFYNSWQRILGRARPRPERDARGIPARLAAGLLARAFVLESRRPDRRGARGIVVARRPEEPAS